MTVTTTNSYKQTNLNNHLLYFFSVFLSNSNDSIDIKSFKKLKIDTQQYGDLRPNRKNDLFGLSSSYHTLDFNENFKSSSNQNITNSTNISPPGTARMSPPSAVRTLISTYLSDMNIFNQQAPAAKKPRAGVERRFDDDITNGNLLEELKKKMK